MKLAELLHLNSQNRPPGALGQPQGLDPVAEAWASELASQGLKRYPTRIGYPLPAPATELGVDVAQAIRGRASGRDFARSPLPLGDVATLLHLGTGVREVIDGDYRRNAPSAGNLGSVALYPLVQAVEGLTPGLYHYDPLDHRVQPLPGSLAAATAQILQPELAGAPLLVALGSSLARVMLKYDERGYRYAHLDAGHVAQNLLLAATALGLSACPLGGFADAGLNAALGLDGLAEAVLYVIAFGRPSP